MHQTIQLVMHHSKKAKFKHFVMHVANTWWPCWPQSWATAFRHQSAVCYMCSAFRFLGQYSYNSSIKYFMKVLSSYPLCKIACNPWWAHTPQSWGRCIQALICCVLCVCSTFHCLEQYTNKCLPKLQVIHESDATPTLRVMSEKKAIWHTLTITLQEQLPRMHSLSCVLCRRATSRLQNT